MNNKIINSDGGIVFAGQKSTSIYQACVIRQGLRLYAATGMKHSSHVGPTKLMEIAARITGKTYKRGRYLEAAADLDEWIDAARRDVEIVDERAS